MVNIRNKWAFRCQTNKDFRKVENTKERKVDRYKRVLWPISGNRMKYRTLVWES